MQTTSHFPQLIRLRWNCLAISFSFRCVLLYVVLPSSSRQENTDIHHSHTERYKTVKCRPLFYIISTFSSFFIGDPVRKVSYIAPFTILCFCCHTSMALFAQARTMSPRSSPLSKSSGNYPVSHFKGSDFINFPQELRTCVLFNPCSSFFIAE